MKKVKLRFTIVSLLVLTFAVALTTKLVAPWSSSYEWGGSYWVNDSVCVVRRIGESRFWDQYALVNGEGNCLLFSEGTQNGTALAIDYRIFVQLPQVVKTGEEFDLRAFSVEGSRRKEIRELENNAVCAIQFAYPICHLLDNQAQPDSVGTLTVKRITEKTVDVRLRFSFESDEPFKIDKVFTLLRVENSEDIFRYKK